MKTKHYLKILITTVIVITATLLFRGYLNRQYGFVGNVEVYSYPAFLITFHKVINFVMAICFIISLLSLSGLVYKIYTFDKKTEFLNS